MPASGLLAILDDIAALMDDTALMAKAAAQKTAGIVGDDVAVNAESVLGINPKREIPIVLKIAKGSLINKCILIPSALTLSALAPWSITPLLMAGGAFLAYEAVHKTFGSHDKKHEKDVVHAAHTSEEAVMHMEKGKIKAAIATDFILSAEIVAVTLGTVAAAPFVTQAAVLCIVGLALTAGVYGFVGGLVKIDDLGLHMMKKQGNDVLSKTIRGLGNGLVQGTPYMMKGLGILGTTAMFLVGGGIIMHGAPFVHHAVEAVTQLLPEIIGKDLLAEGVVGLITGVIASAAWKVAEKPVLRGIAFCQKAFGSVKEKLQGLSKKNKGDLDIKSAGPAATSAAPALSQVPDVSSDLQKAATPAAGTGVQQPLAKSKASLTPPSA